MEIEVIRPGSKVFIGDEQDPISGRVLAASVDEHGSVGYQVVWWEMRSRHVEWFATSEVRRSNERPRQMGFRFNPPSPPVRGKRK